MNNFYIQKDESLPTHCPCCGNNLIWEGVDLVCDDINCPNVEASNLQQWCEIVGETDGLQWTLMNQWLLIFHITTLQELYSLETQKFVLDYFKGKLLSVTEIKIKEFFEKLYFNKISIDKALMALNIPRLGEKTASLLGYEKGLLNKLYHYAMEIENVGYSDTSDPTELLKMVVKEATTNTIMDNLWRICNLEYLCQGEDFLNSRIIFPQVKDLNEIKYIAVTGSLESMKRKDFEAYIKNYGYELSSNLKKCEYLVNNDINSTSTKNKQAKELNVKIVTEKEFLDLINN